jgi:hypothetical protein
MRMLTRARKRLGDVASKTWKKTGENPWLKSIRMLIWVLPLLLGTWHAGIRPGLIRGNIDFSVIEIADKLLADSRFVIPAAFAVFLVLIALNLINHHKEALQRAINQQRFNLTGTGRLLVDNVPHIALSVEAVKSMFEGLKTTVGDDLSSALLFGIGRQAGNTFGQQFPKIYESDIRTKQPNTPAWEKLSIQECLNNWTNYDCSNGWGSVEAEEKTVKLKDGRHIRRVNISVAHRDLLIQEAPHFGYFIAGYFAGIMEALYVSKEAFHAKAFLAQPIDQNGDSFLSSVIDGYFRQYYAIALLEDKTPTPASTIK